MGAAIATRVAGHPSIGPELQVLVVLDVVEGTAMAALPQMRNFISRYPSTFKSPHAAVKWALQAGVLNNRGSAEMSIPSQLRPADDGDEGGPWRWRVDLASTEPHWRGWFEGLTSSFLSVRCYKALVLTGNEKLDKDLTIAMMQGKFMFELVPKSGHILEEDQPQHVADILAKLARRIQLTQNLPQPPDRPLSARIAPSAVVSTPQPP
eukprot:GHVU01008988.1.p1 GENE.GHVU01008988.1~~GHVU01008988.1.p1  ORF type:complete len:208 (+),score=23.01 GHVU01008988.1:3731-4354(+)